MGVDLVEPICLDVADIGVGGDVIAREVVVDDMTEARVHEAGFMERHGEAHDHSACTRSLGLARSLLLAAPLGARCLAHGGGTARAPFGSGGFPRGARACGAAAAGGAPLSFPAGGRRAGPSL